MRILIVEDEPLAVAQLSGLILSLRPNIEIAGVCDTVKSTVRWIEENGLPDLAFFDIQLGDGLSFGIFEKTRFTSPVIFTTTFDEYAIQAFKVNSIDYLLKPLHRDDMERALLKFEQLSSKSTVNFQPEVIELLRKSINSNHYKKRFLIKIGDRLKAVNTDDILFFYSLEKATFVKTCDGKDYLLDQTLESIEQLVNPADYFRINRKYLLGLKAINDVFSYGNSRLKLKVKHAGSDDFLVAREKVKAFKCWFEGDIME
ncbi:LytR/AlgR family response regulator transcription factor [Roseimarinus sediminis]|uniref:LytR/AlgR family response regulator transcription factor n=1 Tax=Roseimarinus sediminis TaxID=1610899 RepID=UPI003D1EBCF8